MTRLMAIIRSFSAQIWAWLKPGGPWLGLRRFVGAMLVLAAFVTFGQTNSPLHAFGDWVTGSGPGQITLSQPLVYTRERLVDDRLEQINWLNQRLRALDREIEPAFQSTEGRIERSRMVGAGVTPPPGASGGTGAAAPGGAPTAQPHQPLLETTMSRFQQMNLYREALRAERMRAILDDRHDIAGNTVFQLSFEATVLPSRSGKGAGIVALQIREDNEGKNNWSDLPAPLKYEYERLYQDWISVLRRDIAIGIEGRIRALDAPAGRFGEDGPAVVLRALRVLVCSADPRVRIQDDGSFISRNEVTDDCEAWSRREPRRLASAGFEIFEQWFEREVEKAHLEFESIAKRLHRENMERAFRDPLLLRLFSILDGDQPYFENRVTFRNRIEQLTNYDAALRVCVKNPWYADIHTIPFLPLEQAKIRQSGAKDIMEVLNPSNSPPSSPPIGLNPLDFPCPARYSPSVEAGVLLDLYRRTGKQKWGHFAYAFRGLPQADGNTIENVRIIETGSPMCAAVYARYQAALESFSLPPTQDHGFDRRADKRFRLSDHVQLTVVESLRRDTSECQIQVLPIAQGARKLYEFLQANHREIFTYGLSPRNDSKRFETVTEALLQARLSVPLMNVRGQDAEAWYSTLERAQGLQEHISIAGFSNEKSFGWVFLPTRPGLEEKHRLEMKTVQAIVSLPAFWRRAHIKVARCWSHEGQFEAVRSLFQMDFFEMDEWQKKVLPDRAGCELRDLRMRIPGSETEVERALNLEILRTPYVNINAAEEMIAYEGRPASFRLSGGRLWRSTTVTLGGQSADRIRILPDMRGIVAEFDCINHPSVLQRTNPSAASTAGPSFDEVTTYLAVWTSEGTTERTTLPVKIRRAQGAEPYLSCRDINPATQRRPAPPTLRSVPPPSPFTGEVRN